MTTPTCRFCKTPLTQTLVDLGHTPLANSYVPLSQAEQPEPKYPLHARVCSKCRLVQVDDVATPDHIFSHYAYFSSYAASWVEHARKFCESIKGRLALNDKSMVVEVASNDGYLLKHFVAMGVPVLGIEPAQNVAQVAQEAGVPTEAVFFGIETATRLKNQGKQADLIVGNNVLAHVPDINDFVGGFAVLLKAEGVVSVEFPHLLRLIEGVQFDTIYHEHFSYLSLLAVERVFAAHGLKVFDVEELTTHGGSLRVLACRATSMRYSEQPGLHKVRADEAKAKFDSDAAYIGFEPKVRKVRDDLRAFLQKAKADKKTVVAYGAAAKGNTLLNYCGIGTDLIEYVVDKNPHKQNHLLPGSLLPVRDPAEISKTKPDYILILPWNLRDEIISQMQEVRNWGGEFVTAVPQLTIVR